MSSKAIDKLTKAQKGVEPQSDTTSIKTLNKYIKDYVNILKNGKKSAKDRKYVMRLLPTRIKKPGEVSSGYVLKNGGWIKRFID